MLSRIHNCYDSLTDTEKKIADTILSSPKDAVKMTVKELAEHSGTVPSAVVRFCKSIGTTGFSDFKICLSAGLGKKASAAEMLPVGEGDEPKQVFSKVFASGINTLRDTLSMIDFSQTETIVRLLQKATRVVFFGVGTSSVIAMDAQYRFAQLGIATSACTYILFMNVTAANLKAGDVAVCISHSGSTKATVDAMRRAKKAGADTVAISSFAHSRLAMESDYHLIAFSDDKNYPVEAVSARIAHICILDALMMSLASQNYETLQKHIAERNEVLKEIRYTSK
ncbi:MAG: MurR/RpiR family transcriptional regulator [Oscillospiraceae bacterium]|nr:MurR/RpiR family transcriptional regulator [Oscillospiraceae bacterium]